MIKAFIVEDEPGARTVLKSLIKDYASDVTIIGEAGNVEEAVEKINSSEIELLFLDIRLPDGDGFEVLDRVENRNFEVIFTTAYGDYREQAFDNFALHYLTKPIDIDKLEGAIEQFRKKTSNAFDDEKFQMLKQMILSNKKKLAIAVSDGYIMINTEDIIHCEAHSNYTEIRLKGGEKHMTSKSLKYYDEMLNELGFYRIHKSHLINVNYIKEVKSDGTVLLEDGIWVAVSQRSKKEFMHFLESFS